MANRARPLLIVGRTRGAIDFLHVDTIPGAFEERASAGRIARPPSTALPSPVAQKAPSVNPSAGGTGGCALALPTSRMEVFDDTKMPSKCFRSRSRSPTGGDGRRRLRL